MTTILTYKGNLDFIKYSRMVSSLSEKKTEYRMDVLIYKKLITLVIEVMENLIKYSGNYLKFTAEHPQHQPEFSLKCNGEYYLLEAENPIRPGDMEAVRLKIDKVNRMDSKELREFFRETITNGKFSEQGGAGLGFIEMAKISSFPLSYSFKRINADYYAFRLKIRVT
jgi:hypothetical protein